MKAVLFNRRVLISLGITILFVIPLQGQQQPSPPLSEIFLLDLGIMIEPSTGEESYSRVVEGTSKEIDIRIQQVRSGKFETTATQELLTAIERVNSRLSDLETTFQNELMVLQSENLDLQQILAAMAKPVPEKPERPEMNLTSTEPQFIKDMDIEQPPVVKSIVMIPMETVKGFDSDLYIQGMYAYQCGNFATALNYFDDLNLQSAEIEKIENVLYWTADAYLQMHDYEKAHVTLDQLLSHKKSTMVDDALVKKGLLYKELGDMNLALNTFKKVVVGHPESEYSRLAALEIKRGEITLQ